MLRLAICHWHMFLPFFFPTKSWDKAAVSALAWNFSAPVSIWWLQFSPFPLLTSVIYSATPQANFSSHNPASRYLEAFCTRACSKATPSASKHDTGQPHHALPRQNNSFPLGSPQHKLSKHYLRFQVLPYLWLKFSLFRRERDWVTY